jgi:hypothetical protein
VSCQLQTPATLPPGESAPGTHWIGGWVGPRSGMDDVEKRKFLKLPGLELRHLGRPARSQSLYRLSYPGSRLPYNNVIKLLAERESSNSAFLLDILQNVSYIEPDLA